MKASIPELGKLIAQQTVARTRKVKSSWAYVICKDGNMLVHVSLLAKAKHLNPKKLTLDEYEAELHKIEAQDEQSASDRTEPEN